MKASTRTVILLAALLALLALTACRPVTAPAAAPAPQVGAIEPVACDTLGVAPELAAVAECGYVTVPENRAAGTDTTIQLAFVRVPSTSDTPGAPVIVGTGGPGGAGLQGATAAGGGSTFLQTHASILADRDWVFFTQRGSPQARPELACPAYNNMPLEAAVYGWSADEKQARSKKTMQACLDDFAAQGVDLTGYNSAENAADIDTLRQALDYDKINYYGESYGTLLGQYLLRSHPEIVESIILDGIAPATATRWTDVTKIDESFQRVFDACAADEACHANYPDPEGALAKTLADLEANPASYTLTAGEGITVLLKVDDVLAMNALFINLYVPGGYAKLPALIYQLSEGDTSALASTIPLYYSNSGTARVMHLAIACSDDPIASLDEVNLDVPEMYKALILDDAESYATFCPMFGLPHMDDSSDALVESEIPALLLQGGLDPATPVSGGDNVATGLPNSYNIVVPAGTHIQSHDPCVIDIMAAFLKDPQGAPNESCIGQVVPFGVPFAASATSEDGSATITMTLPPTFMPYPNGKDQWFNELPAVVGLAVYPAGTPVEDVLAESTAQVPVPVEIVDGPAVAGLPSKMYRVEVAGQGVEAIVFADDQGTYRINANVLAPDYIASFLDKTLPAILETAQVGPAPEAAGATTGATAMDAISEEDLALFQQVAQEATQRTSAHVQEVCPDASSRTFPLPEPDYDAKRPLDLSAFADALAAFDPARAKAIDGLLAGKAIPDIQALLDGGELTSVELVTYYVDRIQRYDVDRLNSVIELNPQALADAAAADAARGEGNVLGALHGIPVLFKDNIATGGGMHTTAGAYALMEWQPARDAFLVQQLRDAGAIVLGKANLSEWANYMDPCMPSGFSAVGGQTRNPYGPYEIYGSSSGSAASVAAHLTTVAVGSETSGSMIQPARVASVIGLRPSQGLISRDYVVPLGPHLDTPGPMGRSVTDVAILLNALKGVDANDPKTADAAALADVDFTQYLSLDEARKVSVGVIMPNKEVGDLLAAYKPAFEASMGRAPTDAELQAIAESMILPLFGFSQPAALDALKAQGIEVVEIDDATLPWTSQDTAQPQLPYDFNAGVTALFGNMEGGPITGLADVVAINDEDPANRAPYGQSFVEWSAENTLTAEEFARVQTTAEAMANHWMDTVLQQNDVDILVSGMLYSGNAGAAGVPALTVPNGRDPSGRPQGIILSGPYLSDAQLIAVGYALEQALNGRVEPDLDATIEQIDAVTGK